MFHVMDAYVDFQGFRGSLKEFIPKEISIVSSEGPSCTTLLMKPPVNYTVTSSMKKEIKFLEDCYHGLKWNSGYITFENFEEELRTLLQPFNRIYVKGVEKQYLLNFLDKFVINLEDVGCPSLKKLKKSHSGVRCLNHAENTLMCAQENALILHEWAQIDSTNEYPRTSTSVESDSEEGCACCFRIR
uniref:Uncharacterized protein n=1 Tax=Photinus pyralis TaxID=7054 RepID=A0A1Y1LXJ9_PHOPY